MKLAISGEQIQKKLSKLHREDCIVRIKNEIKVKYLQPLENYVQPLENMFNHFKNLPNA